MHSISAFSFSAYNILIMSNRMHITNAIVCGSKHSMTSDKSYLLFTEEIGMIWATARSVRMEKSKQRYALQDFSIIRVSLVQGKSGWRIGSVEAMQNPFLSAVSRTARGGVSVVLKAIRRYIHGEEMNRSIYTDAQQVLTILSTTNDTQKVTMYQHVFILRMLYTLGYITSIPELQTILIAPSVTEASKYYTTETGLLIAKSIEHASEVSHL